MKNILLTAGALLLASLSISQAADVRDKSANPFTLTSTTFKDGEVMPARVSNVAPPGAAAANCIGQNVSPQLAWSHPPTGTKSYAITVVTPEGHSGLGFSDLVVYGIPADVTSFAEGELSKASDKFVGGSNAERKGTYSGPCGVPGTVFHYTFMVIATDLDPKALPPGLTLPELLARLDGHNRRAAGLIGIFTHS